MVMPGPTQDIYTTPNEAQVSHAGEVAQNLENGNRVSAENIGKARDTLLGALRTKSPVTAKWIARSLRQIYVSSTDAQDQAELLGKLVSIGKQSEPVFNEIESFNHPSTVTETLTKAELHDLKDSLSENPEQRLNLILLMLRNRLPREPRPTEPPEGITRRVLRGEKKEDDPISLGDSSVPEEQRLDATLQQGETAIPQLVKLLENPVNREFACAALIHLAHADQDTKQVILQKIRLLQADPSSRPIAEFLRRQIEGTSNDAYDSARAIQEARIPDGWLHRALASCDPLSISNAAAGRESVAIPLAMRMLVTHILRI